MTFQLHIIILPIVTVLLLGSGAAAFLAYFRVRKDSGRWEILNRKDWSHEWLAFTGWVTSTFGAIALVITVAALIPFNSAYWVLTQHEGTIATISNRFVDGSGDVSGATYTLTLEGDQTPRVVTDSRILGLAVGDRVDMTCSLQWVYGGADQQNCYMRSF